jgi:hypothetical protein
MADVEIARTVRLSRRQAGAPERTKNARRGDAKASMSHRRTIDP